MSLSFEMILSLGAQLANPGLKNRPPRVAHVVCTESFAGVERYVTVLSAAMARAGWEVVILGGDRQALLSHLQNAQVSWVPAPTVCAAVVQLRKLRPFDVVHAHMTDAEVASVIAMLGTGVPVVCTRHFAQPRGSSAIRKSVSSLTARRIHTQIAISEFVSSRIEGVSTVIVPGVDNVDDIRPSAERDNQVLMAQRLEPEKRADLGIEAWAASGLAAQGWTLVIAGEGSERRRLVALADELGVGDSCRFLGFRSDVAELQRRAAIFLAPRPDEPLGLSVIEAMAAGAPVVAAGGGGHLETVGLHLAASLYPPFDVADAGRQLAELASDPKRRDEYGRDLATLQRLHLGVETQLAKTIDLYHRVTEETR